MDYRLLENLLAKKQMNLRTLALEAHIPPSTFTDWKNGRSQPKTEKLLKIADALGVSFEELCGVKRKTTDAELYKSTHEVPIVGVIRGGAPIVTEETLMGYEVADVQDTDDYFYLKVTGDSMKDVGILDGSLVLFHKQSYAEEGEIVACLVDSEYATVKRFSKRKKEVWLLPENPDYQPIIIPAVEFESGNARILGLAVQVITKL